MPADRTTIVSLIASATETACALGLRDRIIGRSHECDYPPDVSNLPVLSAPKVDGAAPSGMTDRKVREIVRDGLSVYSVRVDELERLKPGLILTQDHCEVCAVSLADVEDALCRVTLEDTSVCSLHPGSLADVVQGFRLVADAAGVSDRGAQLALEFEARLTALAERAQEATSRPRIAMVEWLDPPMIAGGWMPELAQMVGADPVIVDAPETFKTVSWHDIVETDPDMVVVLPCGFPIQQTRAELGNPELAEHLARVPATGRGQCYVADGNAFFNRPGPRLVESAEILAAIAHPGLFEPEVARHQSSYGRWPRAAL